MSSKEQVGAAVGVIMALAEAVRERTAVPSGELYAVAMAGGLSLESYNGALGVLKRAGLVSVTGHMVRWIGPEIAKVA